MIETWMDQAGSFFELFQKWDALPHQHPIRKKIGDEIIQLHVIICAMEAQMKNTGLPVPDCGLRRAAVRCIRINAPPGMFDQMQ